MAVAAQHSKGRAPVGPQVGLLIVGLSAFVWLLNTLATPPFFLSTVVEIAPRGAWIGMSLGLAALAVVGQVLVLRRGAQAAKPVDDDPSWTVSLHGTELEMRCSGCKTAFTADATEGSMIVCPSCGKHGRVGKLPEQ